MFQQLTRLFVGGMALASLFTMVETSMAENPVVYVSAFAAGEQGGIHAFELDTKAASLRKLASTPGAENPFFLALSPDRKFLYSIHAKVFSGQEDEQVAAYAITGRSGTLKLLGRQSSKGTASCYLDVTPDGKTLVVANYTSGSVASLPIKGDGSLSEPASFFQHTGSSVDPARQKEAHAHCSVISPDGRFMFAADLGLDKVLCYKFEGNKLIPNRQPFARTPPGAGPRHLTFHPNGKFMYVINELSNTITSYAYETESGLLTEKQTISTLPADFKGTSYCADLKITPDGKYLYGTNRGHHSIAAYKIAADGELSLVGIEPSLGDGPQNLCITPDGGLLLCANMPGNNLAIFRIDAKTGALKAAGEPLATHSPSCMMLVP